MGSLSDYAENKILDHVLGVTAWSSPPATIYLALSTTDFTDTGAGGTEPVAMGYIRKAVSFGNAASRVVTQDANVVFDAATGSWGTIAYWGIFDQAALGGNMLAYGSFATGKSVTSGKTVTVPSGQITITANAGKMSTYLSNEILDHMFNGSAYTVPTIYVALAETTEITDSDTGSTIDELDMTGYAREACSAWDAASGGATDNTNIIDFGSLTSTSETVTAACLTDNATKGAGNVLFYDNTPNVSIGDGDTVQFAAGAFDVSIN